MLEPKIQITHTEIISDKHYRFKRVHFDFHAGGIQDKQTREVFDRGNGATILLYNKNQKSIILTRQFRIPTYLNGNSDGMMIEACAGSIDGESPLENIIRETEEETGYKITHATKLFEAYMSPGAVTEIIHFYIAEYDASMKQSAGGGLQEEHEHIEVMELSFEMGLEMIERGQIKDAKTIMLLQYAQLKNIFN